MRSLTSEQRWSLAFFTAVFSTVGMLAVVAISSGVSAASKSSEAEEKKDKDDKEASSSDWEESKASARADCKLEKLPAPKKFHKDPRAGESEVTAMSASGEYILGVAGTDPVLWHDDESEKVTASDLSDGHDVNSDGVVVGNSTPEVEPWMYRDGKREALKKPEVKDEQEVEVIDINDDGYVLGNVVYDNGIDSESVKPVVWHIDSPHKYTTPDIASDADSGAFALTEESTVVGFTDETLWTLDAGSEAKPKNLTTVDGLESSYVLQDYDYIAGGDWFVNDGKRFNVKSGESEKVAFGNTVTDAIDADGRVYGMKNDMPAFADGKKVTELPALAPRDKEVSELVGHADEVSQDGKVIAGTSTDDDGIIFPVTWAC